jgi:predicted kinase
MSGPQLPGCLIVNGMPGSGKTTVTRIIAGLLPRAALLRSEYLAEMVVSGRVWALGEPRSEARRQQLLTNRNMCMLANNFAAEDITPVMDYGLFSRELVDLTLDQLTARTVMLVMLAPGLKVCQDRNAARDDDERLDFDYSPLEAELEREVAGIGWWFDTSALSPEKTARCILSEAAKRAVVT